MDDRGETPKQPSISWTRWGLIELVLTAAFVALAAQLLGGEEGGTGPLVGTIMALAPALIWMVYIYRQDRIAPEPWGPVLGVFVLGGLLTIAVATPAAESVFGVASWSHQSTTATWVADICVVATLQQLCVYLAVRYSVYLTAEFDEPVDGVIYASAAGLGMATVLNVVFVVTNDGVLPLAGGALIACTTLVHVTAAAVLGFGLGRARFGQGGQFWLSLCFILSIVINGGSGQLISEMGTDGATFDPWLALGTALGLGAAVLIVSHLMVRRLYLHAQREGV